jgi:glycine/D-amino acid oxidase-like deaminating enzyme
MNDLDADVLVIGAGITGAMIAFELANQGARVAVVDAQQAGGGATRRALSLATPILTPEHFGDTARSVSRLAVISAQNGVIPTNTSVLHVPGTSARVEALHTRFVELNAHPAQVSWETDPHTLPGGYEVGVIVRNCVMLDAHALCLKLLAHKQIRLREKVEITDVRLHRGSMHALAAGTTVRAGAVVLATNAAVGLFSKQLAANIRLSHGSQFVSKPGPVNRCLPLIIDGGRVNVVHGKDGRTQVAAWQPAGSGINPATDLSAWMKSREPALAEQTESTAQAVLSTTEDGAPFVDRLDGDGNVFFAVGLGVFGLAWTALVAEAMAELVQGD